MIRVPVSTSDPLNKTSELTVYPNPSQQFVWVDLSPFKGNCFINLIDSNGRKLQLLKMKGGGKVKIDLDGYQARIYFIQASDKDNIMKRYARLVIDYCE